jgi:hypothetical protein
MFAIHPLPIAIFLKPPFDSVPHLMRPVGSPGSVLVNRLNIPSNIVPTCHPPVTQQSLIVTFSAARASPRAHELLRQMPSSEGEFTLQPEIRTLRQQSTFMTWRVVSIFRWSSVKLSAPLAKIVEMATGEDRDIAQRHIITVLQGESPYRRRPVCRRLALHPEPPCPGSVQGPRSDRARRYRHHGCARPKSGYCPNQAIVPVVVSEILIILPRSVRFRRVVAPCRRRQKRRTRL